ncbi:NAD-dependent epimerase/dehydratase family protein [Amycolatopsis sp. NPDC059090]|uniref:NAD-dependent epimerase/dehydratase family protein n=1 Tax=unclassified Amycolatopsis TaxID=2618356 RepID=UPI00367282BF
MTTAMVLGGSGFLGRHLCTAFAADGWNTVCVSRRPDPVAGARTVSMDLAEVRADALAGFFEREQPDVVVNAAGAVWRVDDGRLELSNVVLVKRLTAALAASDRKPRLLQLGTVHEYGLAAARTKFTEKSPSRPVTEYGRTKARATEIVLSASLDAVVLRVGNVAGPGTPEGSLLGNVAASLASSAASGAPAELELPPPTVWRDYVDVRDVVRAVLAAAAAPAGGRIINVSRGQAVRVRELVAHLVAVSGAPARIVGQPATRRETWQEADITAARELLGWQPRHDLADSIRTLWAVLHRGSSSRQEASAKVRG